MIQMMCLDVLLILLLYYIIDGLFIIDLLFYK